MADTEKRYFLMINDLYFSFSPETTLCSPVSKDEFSHLYNSEIDKLTIVPRIIKIDHCPGCDKPDAERAKEGGIPSKWENEDQYLSYIYSEADPQKQIKAKQIFDKQFRS